MIEDDLYYAEDAFACHLMSWVAVGLVVFVLLISVLLVALYFL